MDAKHVSDANASKRQCLGLNEYSNSSKFSDVTIRYGNAGEVTFDAHKVILSAKSFWFKKAFAGAFMESDAKGITLHDDNPSAVTAMLVAAYDGTARTLPQVPSATSIRVCIDIYRVADKYDFPDILIKVRARFHGLLSCWLVGPPKNGTSEGPRPSSEAFCEIIADVYELPDVDSRSQLVKVYAT
ncbi:hypothetical protein BKA63DRAFT_561730 [Paraphoma chrysanthemicola]|nr:hypothetical protein BKA63DRAFT_561730 [Paraphoma chrysanthemicola]